MDNLIHHKEQNGILTITLNRFEKKNALTGDMYMQLCHLFNYASKTSSVHCVVIQGDDQCFCAGNDLQDFLACQEGEELAAFTFVQTLAAFDKPLVAAVAGPAVGIGTTLLLHADIVVASPNSKFALPFSQIGLCPEAGSSALLTQLVGHVKAFELLVIGQTFSAEKALALNLITEVISSDELLDKAQTYAETIAALPHDAVLTSRRLLKEANQSLVKKAMASEFDAFSRLMQTDECKSILSKFLSK
ncbi:enoyl-CoA hydratase-related protein [Thalassotalea euphylliae]|uniref:enoyl-CoA hydratase-related protein n=1 Tax=Thalassotalea euphylliae TaxID=1655234 RepID=UPI003636E58A